uniref:YqgF/RNase H-like domain-containing protein n=1 Tax=Zea mays TaxID=4577 RepID=A0A804LNB1_MAIZE|eukprot:XP_008677118.1 holliday junction resolvase isoform X1 [Zea mays]
MTTAAAVEPAPLVRARACAASASFPPPRRRRAAGAIRASPVPGRTEAAAELPAPLQPNARRRGRDPLWHGGGFSLGVDLGDARTGLAIGRGITFPRPLTVLRLRGQKLELALLDVARQQEADELIIGLPVSADGSETPQSNKVRSVVGRLAVQAAQSRGLRVYLQDEYGTSTDALDYMISRGVKKSARDTKSDAYAAVMILKRYFTSSGRGAKIVLPRQPELQDKLMVQSRQDAEV